ncbi:uncharacterized protein LOC142345381 [Convolutriloba macropyga]|uniref:uncharacterized protein LOC142345381 n=1 Tax=Convolutriloba macropyga TaxID=536237 RepID=UPI003F520FEE
MPFPDKPLIKLELMQASVELSNRGLKQSSIWCGEQGNNIEAEFDAAAFTTYNFYSDIQPNNISAYVFAKSLFDNKEYMRAVYHLETAANSCTKCSFLKLFSKFLNIENKKIENQLEPAGPMILNTETNESLQNLLVDLSTLESVDGYHCYLMGLVLKRLQRNKDAVAYFCKSVCLVPMIYASWYELKSLVMKKEELNDLKLPTHWMKDCFMAEVNSNFQMNVEVVQKLMPVFDAGFEKSPHFFACLAKAHHNLRDFDSSIECFEELRNLDPYRLENLDTLSNDYYVKGKRVELSVLAHDMMEISKYRHETCCVIGNYYSYRQEHEKAVTYFQRALKLNPNYIDAWTLMGHELIEMKNTNGAVQAYRRAVEIDPSDFRAWYGLGQTYEILRMHLHSVYYFQQAHVLRPNDSRFLVALGACYESLDKNAEAEKCYWKAYSVGDSEGSSLLKLGKIFEKQDRDKDKEEKAVAIYQRYVDEVSPMGTVDMQEQGGIFLYLAKYYLKHSSEDGMFLDQANEMANKATHFKNTREAARALQKEVVEKRKEKVSQLMHPVGGNFAQNTLIDLEHNDSV